MWVKISLSIILKLPNIELKLVAYTIQQFLLVDALLNVISRKKKLRIFQPIEFPPLSAIVILWCQRDARIDHDILKLWYEFHFFNAYAIAPFLIINFRKRIQLTCIELILECFGFSPYLVYFSFSLFIGHCVLKMPGSFEVNQWNWL